MIITDVKGSYKDGITFSSDPLIHVIDGMVNQEESDYIINLAKTRMTPAAVITTDGISVLSDTRSATHCWLNYNDDVIKTIGERISRYVGIPISNAEDMQVIYYGVGDQYKPHHDAFDMFTTQGQKSCVDGGQRLVTALIYLNAVTAGGETEFPVVGIKVNPSRGRMVVFNNTSEDVHSYYFPSLHAALPVIEGEKWAINIWFRMMPRSEKFSPPYTEFPKVKFI